MRRYRIQNLLLGACLAVAFALGLLPPDAGAQQAAAPQGAAAQQDPAELVRTVSTKFLADLSANRPEYKGNPQKLRQLVDQQLLPFFDINYSARLVLGRHWRDASPQQRQEFMDAFENSMLQNYGNALVDFNSNRLKVLPQHGTPSSGSAIVRTEITRDDGSALPVNYVMHQTPQGWKAWDVVIEGISYVKSFRDDFAAQIDQQGLDAVIERIEKGNVPAAPKGQKQ